MRRILLKVVAFTGAIVLFGSSSVYAFSGYGNGTSNPYNIGSCEQLQEMQDDLGGSYRLVRNIDCAEFSFTPVGDSEAQFSGTLNGQGFAIKNLTISTESNDVGLFGSTDDATISNLKLVDFSISASAHTAALVGAASFTQISDVRVEGAEITGTDNVGALVGQMGAGTVYRSSATGITIQANSSQIGGLIGSAAGGAFIIDSYAQGSVTSPSNFIGGLIGHMDSGPVQLVSSYADVDIFSTGNHVGGLVGYTTGSGGQSISHSFSASSLMVGTTEESTGALFGTSNATTLDLWFDDGASSWDSCVGAGSALCTAANSDNSTPNYFKNNNTVAPLDEWDFDGVWVASSGAYPSLKPLTYTGVTGAPNSNDADADGTDDSYQPNVHSVRSEAGIWSTIKIPSGNGCSVENPTSVAAPSGDTAATYALAHMTGFSLYCATSGVTVPVTIIFDKVYDTSSLSLRHYNSTNSTYSTVTGVTFGTVTVGGVTKTTAKYNVTDGGVLDTDGVANGIIVDPVSLASIKTLADTGSSNSVMVALSYISIIVGAFIMRRQMA